MAAQEDNLTGKESAVNVTDDREARPKFWIAVYTKSRCEKKVAQNLAKDGIETYVPVQKVKKQWSDRTKVIDIVIIPLVIFAYVTKDDILTIKKDFRVLRILTYPGRREAAIIPDGQIRNLQLILSKAETPVEFMAQTIKLKDTVMVKEGKLKGLHGIVERIGEKKSRLLIRIDLLGGVLVDINSQYIEIL